MITHIHQLSTNQPNTQEFPVIILLHQLHIQEPQMNFFSDHTYSSVIQSTFDFSESSATEEPTILDSSTGETTVVSSAVRSTFKSSPIVDSTSSVYKSITKSTRELTFH